MRSRGCQVNDGKRRHIPSRLWVIEDLEGGL